MKLKIVESNYLFEDIEAVKKYYPNIDDDVFMQLIQLDPTYRDGSNSVGKYGKWILNLFNKGTIAEKDFKDIAKILNQFTTYRNRVQNKDLNSYKTLDDLSDTLAQVVDDDSMLSDRQKLRFKKNVKAGRVSTAAEDDYNVVFEDDQYIVYVPNTHEASMKLGKGTKWCTAHENRDWYDKYTKDGHKLYIVKDKETGKRWQYSDKNGDFLDQYDDDFDIPSLMRQDEKLSKFFKQFLGVDYYSFDGTWIYTGQSIPNDLLDSVKNIIIADGVTSIGNYAFWECTSLTSITIPNSVTNIGNDAFYDCSSLKSITIPDSVTNIAEAAFQGCSSLKNITISNSVTSIDGGTFYDCSSLTSIVIPDSVKSIGEEAFSHCSSLASINIPNSITSIGRGAFYYCSSLKSIVIPNGVKSIDSGTFHHCYSLKSIIIPDSVISIADYAFAYCPKLTVYTDNDYVIQYCDENDIETKPQKEFKNESIRRDFKLKIKEDTACVASKTSYMDEDGLDKNGIYYFGDKPKLPVNWKDYKKDDNKKYGLKEGSIMKLRINESIADENGMFMQMDDAMDGLIGNVGDDDIDEVVKYYSTISGKLGKKDKFSDIVCYFCSDYADVCDPIDSSKIYFDFKPVYKSRKFDSYVSSKYGDKFVIDHFNDNFMFTVYATNEDVINRLMDDLSNEYDNL